MTVAAAADRHLHLAERVVRLADAELLEQARELGAIAMRRKALRLIDEPVESRIAGEMLLRGRGKKRVAHLAIVTRLLRRLRDERRQRARAFVAERARDGGPHARHRPAPP